MTNSYEFTTWVALAGAAIGAGLWRDLFVFLLRILVAGALVGACLGYQGERIGRRYLERYLSQEADHHGKPFLASEFHCSRIRRPP